MEKLEQTISSVEVAEMIGKDHNKLLRDIRSYIDQFSLSKIGQSDFFTDSTYKNGRGKEYPCYQVTKKGCEFIDIPCSVESILVSNSNIKAIISFSSTVLITAKLLFKIKAISILNLLDINMYGAYIQDEMHSFIDCFSSLVDMPKSLSELRSLTI